MKKLILVNGIIMIIVVTICTFNKDEIKYKMVESSIMQKYGSIEENNYFIEDNFTYVDNYTDPKIESKTDLINSIYYLLNTGTDYAERYCDINYTSCVSDIEELIKDDYALSLLNNFVHPYNSFEQIVLTYDSTTIGIEFDHVYSSAEIKEIDEKVDKFIAEKITNDMGTQEKIKLVHDYIIDNTSYDSLKSEDINDTTFKSNTAYGVLFQGQGICSGYSDAMAIFLNKLNIINYKISNDNHIWNLVYIDGKWLHLDLTWDDPISEKNITRDTYFLITTDNLEYLNDTVHTFNKSTFKEAV